MNEPAPQIADAQILVQQALGRCLLRIQQYEMLLKRLAAHIDLQGPVDEILGLQQKKAEGLQNKTLGQLVRILTDDYMVASDGEGSDAPSSGQAGWFRFRSKMLVSEESFLETKSALTELVSLRNLLAHHFIERFDIRSLHGCNQAQAFLEESLESIANHYFSLLDWAKSFDNIRELLNSALQDFLDGIDQDGSVSWPVNGLTDSLIYAEEALSQGGWTPLSEAIRWCSMTYPAQTLRRYGCASWREVIHKSGLFETRKSIDPKSGNSRIHYRSKPEQTGA
ncbi:OST-HTH/LOTUS domain-containing protein [Pseudomonas abietaniphila]|uniref:OST-HTH/LOTUS domain-containing protein n=1 Tax=Pseudomonas abietaniphila TaxID=89065 RepID=A0A1G8SG20_9PSED|nr:OST-HTH/LOTUS domain-containing protein [Pseudomonas abietaniphila]SDJ28104.1 OST-HTH/LOTUS domain-containing protein [Pseudomonas abietaniphila]